jgi:AraC-like DNA-binding protein
MEQKDAKQEKKQLRLHYNGIEMPTLEARNILQGMVIHSDNEYKNRIVFLLSGRAILNSTEGLNVQVGTGEFFFLPASAEMSMMAKADCRCIVVCFDNLTDYCDLVYFRDLRHYVSKSPLPHKAYAMNNLLYWATADLWRRFTMFSGVPGYVNLALDELMYLLRCFYTREQMAEIFRPVIGMSLDFRGKVMKYYSRVKRLDEIADMLGMNRKSFDAHFSKEFGQPPYQWLLQQKAKHVFYSLATGTEAVNEVMHRYGFNIATHFSRFCRDYFNATPYEVRNKHHYT